MIFGDDGANFQIRSNGKPTFITEDDTTYTLALTSDLPDEEPIEFAEEERLKTINLCPEGTVTGIATKDVLLFEPLPAGTYTFSCVMTSSDTNDTKGLVEMYLNDTWVGWFGVNSRGTRVSSTKTVSSSFNILRFYASPTSAGSQGDTFTYSEVQLEEGSVATPYKEYYGKITHNGDTIVKFAESERQKSKNLFPYAIVDGYNIVPKTLPNPLPTGTYTFSAYVSSEASQPSCLVEFYKNNSWQTSFAIEKGGRQSKTFNLPNGCDIISFIASTDLSDASGKGLYFGDVQIEVGSEATPYQPHNGAIVHEKDIKRTVATAYLPAGFQPANKEQDYKLPLTLYNSSNLDNKLSLNADGGFVIGKNVSKVLVSAREQIYISAVGYDYLRIYKNNDVIQNIYLQTRDSAWKMVHLVAPPILIDVAEGDVISLAYRTRPDSDARNEASGGTGIHICTYMTLEVVE
jgi:hypothetical protein